MILHLETITIQIVMNPTRTVVFKWLSPFWSPAAGTLHSGVSELRWAQGRSCCTLRAAPESHSSSWEWVVELFKSHNKWLLLCHVRADRERPGCLWSWYLGNITPPAASVSTAWAQQDGHSSTSAAWITLGLKREAQLSADVSMGMNTLEKKRKKKRNLKMQICFAVSNMFLSIVYKAHLV